MAQTALFWRPFVRCSPGRDAEKPEIETSFVDHGQDDNNQGADCKSGLGDERIVIFPEVASEILFTQRGSLPAEVSAALGDFEWRVHQRCVGALDDFRACRARHHTNFDSKPRYGHN